MFTLTKVAMLRDADTGRMTLRCPCGERPETPILQDANGEVVCSCGQRFNTRGYMLPTVTDDMKLVLTHTAQLKNSYSGESDIRYMRAAEHYQIPRERWAAAQLECVRYGYLVRHNNAITPEGRAEAERHRYTHRVRA